MEFVGRKGDYQGEMENKLTDIRHKKGKGFCGADLLLPAIF
jgi:hypothetical protein